MNLSQKKRTIINYNKSFKRTNYRYVGLSNNILRFFANYWYNVIWITILASFHRERKKNYGSNI